MRDAIAVRLGYDPFTPDKGPLVRAHVRREGGRLLASIELRDEGGKVQGARDLSSARLDCVELSAVMALTIALAIDPLAPPESAPKRAESEPRGEVVPPPAPAPEQRTDPPENPVAVNTSSISDRLPSPPFDRWRFGLSGGIGISIGGAAPSTAPTLLPA